MAAEVRYELFYWSSLQGRGELVRLLFEDAGVPYVDVARLDASDGGGDDAVVKMMRGEGVGDALLPFAPPIVRVTSEGAPTLLLAQTASILHYLSPRFDLAPDGDEGRAEALQLQLTLADVIGEVHDTHHPIATNLYYEDQRPEARRRAAHFLDERMGRFLRYFERVLERQGDRDCLIGDRTSYVDLSLYQVLRGLEYAFPAKFARLASSVPRQLALRDRIAERPRLAAYLASPRRIPFNESGIFRHYPELESE